MAVKEFSGRYYIGDDEFYEYFFVEGNPDGDNNVGVAYIQDSNPPRVQIIPINQDGSMSLDSNILNLNIGYIIYETLEKLDPTVKG